MTVVDLFPGPEDYFYAYERQTAAAYLGKYALELVNGIRAGSVKFEVQALAAWSAYALAQAEGIEYPTATQAAELVKTEIEKIPDIGPITVRPNRLRTVAKTGLALIEPTPGRHIAEPLGERTLLDVIGLVDRGEYRFPREVPTRSSS